MADQSAKLKVGEKDRPRSIPAFTKKIQVRLFRAGEKSDESLFGQKPVKPGSKISMGLAKKLQNKSHIL